MWVQLAFAILQLQPKFIALVSLGWSGCLFGKFTRGQPGFVTLASAGLTSHIRFPSDALWRPRLVRPFSASRPALCPRMVRPPKEAGL
ncbi:hypothetical protein BD309DRAFT_948740 [Dichomitus squalens]|nr:hypothetical protein BD309DRAFT_948740 [Dichomitus squalens]